MECVGTASDPYAAREMIRALNPDVITLDIEMPRMDGIDFLSKLMRLRPMPVVMVSTLTERGAEVTLKALELGAVDFVAKPKIGVADGLKLLAQDITDKVRIASKAHLRRLVVSSAADDASAEASTRPAAPVARLGRLSTEKIIFIGASTGGTEATKEVLMHLPPDSPAVVITQHMPAGFTKSYAARLDGLCKIRVAEARDGDRILPGHAYIAPGGFHLSVERSGANYVACVADGEPVNRHKPSVEVLFKSAARVVGPNALALMLTGMGADGAKAMKEMRDAGSYNYAQDEASCVVFGMPREAIAAGAAHEVLPLSQIAPKLIERLRSTAGMSLNRV
jgi:two-component system chemotaxis response regulator CheB